MPTLLGKGEQKEHDYLYWEFKAQRKKAILQKNWKLVVLNVANYPTYELYNLVEDRAEQSDIAEQHPEKLAEMKALLVATRTKPQLAIFEFKTNADKKNQKND